jgi:hypothetical protein
MNNTKLCWWTPFRYAVPADYENWFEQQALEGWHPVRVGQWSSFAMRFEKGEPKRYRYVVDMQPAPRKDYRRIYEEFGWEFVGQMASSYVWRREYQGERPESFSDLSSRHSRNKRFFWAIAVSGIMLALGALVAAGAAIFAPILPEKRLELALEAGFCALIAAALGAVMVRIRKNLDR